MSEVAIRAESIGKLYQLGVTEKYNTIRESISRAVVAPFHLLKRSNRDFATDGPKEFWALRDVSFEVGQGEVFGIIGRNGAGKSTLLKILSRITEPTKGRIDLYGRVASLLEVGTGFHPELTGRENIYLNGSILGMRKREIGEKFDEIVNFAGIEQFLDTPVKRYSSGMAIRLGFSVAAHLDPDILIVDEVLAVGDAEFQRKCLMKMNEVSNSGRTVLYVSHNMSSIQNLCARCMLLHRGVPRAIGSTEEVLHAYLSGQEGHAEGAVDAWLLSRPSEGMTRVFKWMEVESLHGLPPGTIKSGENLQIRIELNVPNSLNAPNLSVEIEDPLGFKLATSATKLSRNPPNFISGRLSLRCTLDKLPLKPGKYFVSFGFDSGGGHKDHLHRALAFDVLESDIFGTGRLPPEGSGAWLVNPEWSVVQ